ncbi:flavodoxin [Hoylesella oralis]|uniref:flavodoxin n=1 Tax=Hoylesella oralis TaxID=28134 RepID=UPI0028EBB524|nr:flavodoxin [Hoylesella oralis]
MKRTVLAIATAMLIIVAACAQGTSQKKEGKKMKTLVAYFSATGTTKQVAEQLAAAAGADLFEITPQKPYTNADLDWTNNASRSSVEMKDLSYRPPIAKTVSNITDYDTVYIGFPIWWYTAPTIINTFIESCNLQGKTVVPFATSGGSSIKKASNDLKKAYPAINWKAGRLLNSPTQKELKEFVAE